MDDLDPQIAFATYLPDGAGNPLNIVAMSARVRKMIEAIFKREEANAAK